MHRADHAEIFVLIAGSYTPITAPGLPQVFGSHEAGHVMTVAATGCHPC